MTILIIGSANLDHTVRIPLPLAVGETGIARSTSRHPGGKGANQAVAAARAGLLNSVTFAGCVGDDQAGKMILDRLKAEGVNVEFVRVAPAAQTGVAYVSTFDDGNNSIAVLRGANLLVDDALVGRAFSNLAGRVSLLVLQGEIAWSTNATALRSAASQGVRALLNLAPYNDVGLSELAICDPLVVNESEASALLGRPVEGAYGGVSAAADLVRHSRSAVVTLGSVGAAWAEGSRTGLVKAQPVENVVDTTGAGDALVGTMAAALVRGLGLEEALELGVLAGSHSVTRPGAQTT